MPGKGCILGTMTLPGDGEYVGEFRDGLPNGLGMMTYLDGKRYVGKWKNGFPNGQGTMTYPYGMEYDGGWKKGEYHGQGTATYPDGSRYVGKWKNGEWRGQSLAAKIGLPTIPFRSWVSSPGIFGYVVFIWLSLLASVLAGVTVLAGLVAIVVACFWGD